MDDQLQPALINISYEVQKMSNTNREYSQMRGYLEERDRMDNLVALVYSDNYKIVKDEYIVQGDYTLHHLIASRVKDNTDAI